MEKKRWSAVVLCLSLVPLASAQNNVLSVTTPQAVTAKAGSTVPAKLTVELRQGYHCNSNTPSDEYLIPLKLTWTAAPLEIGDVVYPKPQMETYSFSDKPLSVYTGDFEIVTNFKVPAGAALGHAVLAGKLRYQACTDRMCLPPKTVDIKLPIDVTK